MIKTPEAEKIWAEGKRKQIGTTKIRCKCGRRIVVKREQGRPRVDVGFMCGTCRAIGLEKSREEYLRLHKQKSSKTILEIKDGLEDKGVKKKKNLELNNFGGKWDSPTESNE